MVVVIAAVAATVGGSNKKNSSVTTDPAPVAQSPGAAPTTSKASVLASFIMPNEVGKGLQDAQDDIQRVSHDPVFISHSHDLRGSRRQILDRDWKVCDQNIAPGTTAKWDEHIDFGVVKTGETCP